MSIAERRVPKELENLPAHAKVLALVTSGDQLASISQVSDDGRQASAEEVVASASLLLHVSSVAEPLEILLLYMKGYPFRPPRVFLEDSHGPEISPYLPCGSGKWSPARRVTDILDELEEVVAAATVARQYAVAEIAELRSNAESRPWLLHITEPSVPLWINDQDWAAATNSQLDPVCPPGCSKLLRRSFTMKTKTETEQVGALRRPVPCLGPWRVHVVVRGPLGSEYDHSEVSRGIRLELTFGQGFPQQTSRVTVLSIMQHLLGASSMSLLFYQSYAAKFPADERCITSLLDFFQAYLATPLPELPRCGLPHAPSIKGDEALLKWHDAAKSNKAKLQRIGAYKPLALHAALYDINPWPRGLDAWLEWGLAPGLGAALLAGSVKTELDCVAPGVYAFDLFTDDACEKLLAELENYERVAGDHGWHVSRPNSMNNYGVILNDIGLEPWADCLQADILQPIASELFPKEGAELTQHHSFLVAYEPGADLGLDMHTDASDVTFNLCLGKTFTGAGLVFCGLLGSSDHRHFKYRYEHRKGRCVVHLGRHRHGADEIIEGQRRNLIIWNTNSCFRESSDYLHLHPPFHIAYSAEGAPPDLLCVSRTYDRDASELLKDSKRSRSGGQQWCPPDGKEFRRDGST